jgi:hypothetical protein
LKTLVRRIKLSRKQYIEKHQNSRKNYEELQQQLYESGDTQISASDLDSRHMTMRGNIIEVAYNAQVMTDAAHCILIDCEVTNENDKKAMGAMLERACKVLSPAPDKLKAHF